jgi:hypothetical protein
MNAQFPTQPFNQQRVWLVGLLALAFAAGIVASSLAAAITQDRPGIDDGANPGAGASAPRSEYAAYRATMADMAAAVARHDWTTAAQYRVTLDRQLTSGAVQGLYADRVRLLRNLAAAEARGDRKLYEAFKAQLADLCPVITTGSVPGFCN